MKADALQKARNYCFLLLKFRLRSEKEVYQRLKNKKFDEQIIRETLIFLKDKGFLDDNLFAKSWIDSRLKKPLGIRRIRQELKLKGIGKEIIDARLGEVKNNYSEEEVVAKIVNKRLKRLRDEEPRTAKRRLYAYLMRRGFSTEAASSALTKIGS